MGYDTWLVYNIALAVAVGKPVLGRFATRAGHVLLVDNELHSATLADRIPKVAKVMGLKLPDYSHNLDVLALRGMDVDLNELASRLIEYPAGRYDLLIVDAWYRVLPAETNESDNAQITRLYNLIDATTARMGAAWLNVHHASKGNQREKAVTDIGSGAGAQSRAADTHIVIRPHQQSGIHVLEAAVRSFPPIEPVALCWKHPLWTPTEKVDTTQLEANLTRLDKKQLQRDAEGKAKVRAALNDAGAVDANTGISITKIREATGYGRDRTNRLVMLGKNDGSIGETAGEYRGAQSRLIYAQAL